MLSSQSLLKFPYGRNTLCLKNIYPLRSNTDVNLNQMYYSSSNVVYNSTLNPNVVSTSSSSYNMPSSNTILIATASSNAITITLPTAIGIRNVYYKIIRTDTTLANVITINTTSSQTIGGSGTSRTMYTANEVWELESDGSNWQIINHYAKTSYTTISSPSISSIGGTVTPGTGTFLHTLQWKRDGKNIIIVYQYRHTVAGSSTGTSYLFTVVPNGITIDTSLTGTYTTVAGAGAFNLNSANPTILIGDAMTSNSTSCGIGIISVYSTTQIRLFVQVKSTNNGCVGTGYFNVGGASGIVQYTFSCIIPITQFYS